MIIRYIPAFVFALIAVFCPSLYARLKASHKASALVETAEAEKSAAEADAAAAKAELDLSDKMRSEVDAAEQTYGIFDEIAKERGLTSGAMKKSHVLAILQAYALEKGYAFSAEKWGAAIDEYVAATKRINYPSK